MVNSVDPDEMALIALTEPSHLGQPRWLGCASDWRPGGCGLDPRRGRQHSFVSFDHEIFSRVLLSLPLIQEGQ